MEAPKDSIAEGSEDLVKVFDSSGVMETAVPEAKFAPRQPITPAPTETEIIQEERFEATAPALDPTAAFAPEDVSEEVAVQRGSFGATFAQGFDESLTAALMDMDNLTPSQRDKLTQQVQNYSIRNPKSAIAGQLVGRFTGDAPLDILIALTTGGMGTAMRAANALGTFGKSAMRVERSLDSIQSGAVAGSALRNMGQDAIEGFAAGVISEQIKANLGRGGTLSSSIEAGLGDAIISPLFGVVLRSASSLAGKAISSVRPDVKSRILDEVSEDTGIAKADLEEAIDDKMEESLTSVEPSVADVQEVARELTQYSPQAAPSDAQVQAQLDGSDTVDIYDEARKVLDELDEMEGKSKTEYNQFEWEDSQKASDRVRDNAEDYVLSRLRSTGDGGFDVDKKTRSKALTKLRRLVNESEKPDADNEAILVEIDNLHQELEIRNAERRLKTRGDRVRGADFLREKVLQAKRKGDIDEDGAELFDWFLRKNPQIADDLGISIRTKPEDGVAAGSYDPTMRLVTLFKEAGDDLTAVHEVLHHTERMLPTKYRRAIRKEYHKSLLKLRKKGDTQVKNFVDLALEATAGKRSSYDAALAMLKNRLVPKEMYQYINPSEFWAVNASSLLSRRFENSNSVFRRIKTWLREFLEKAKSVFGLRSDAALIRGLDQVIKGNGEFVQQDMLAKGKDFLVPEFRTKREMMKFANAERKKQKAKAAEKKLLKIQEMTGDKQQAQIDLYESAIGTDPATNIDGGSLVPKTGFAKRMIKWMDASPFFSWFNYDLQSLTQQLGGAFKKVHELGMIAENVTGDLLVKMNDAFSNAMDGIPMSARRALTGTQKVKIMTDDGEIELELSGFERLKLVMYARDGRKQDLSGGTQHSSSLSLSHPDGGLQIGRNNYILTKDQVKDLASNDSGFLSSDEMKMVQAFESGYRSIVPDANKIGNDYIAENIFNVKNELYTPKNTIKAPDELPDKDTMFNKMFDYRKTPAKGAVMERQGFAPLKLVNPFDEFNLYMKRTSHELGHIEYNKSLETLLSGKARLILEDAVSPKLVRALDQLLAVSRGDRSKLGKPNEGMLAKLFSLRQVGILAYNPSAAVKQFGSGLSAVATGKIDWNAAKISGRIAHYAANKKKADAKIAEIRSAVPMFDARQLEMSRVFDLDDIVGGTSHLMMGRKELSAKEITEMMASGDLKVSDASLELAQKGMVWIKKMDEATVSAVWDATVEKVDNMFKFETGDSLGNFKDRYGSTIEEARKNLFTDMMMESQPTRSPLTLSINQMSGGVFSRMFTQFSTQTRHNADLAYRALFDLVNSPMEKADRAKFMAAILPLAYQAAYISAAGYGATSAVNFMTGQLASEKTKRDRERQERKYAKDANVAKDMFTGFMKAAFGQVPITGGLISNAFSAAAGGPIYEMTPPMIQEAMGVVYGIQQEAKGQQGVDDIVKAVFRLMGVPIAGTKAVTNAMTNISD